MNTFCRLVAFNALLLGLSQLSMAVQPGGQTAPRPSSVDTTGTVERGGMVNAIDLQQKTFVVDGVSYPFSAAPVKIHPPSGATQEKNFVLKVGMQIRFNTSNDNWSRQQQVREIWVTSIDGNSARR